MALNNIFIRVFKQSIKEDITISRNSLHKITAKLYVKNEAAIYNLYFRYIFAENFHHCLNKNINYLMVCDNYILSVKCLL
jgi:hypothetical protein